MSSYKPEYVTVLGQDYQVAPDYDSADPLNPGAMRIDPVGMYAQADKIKAHIGEIGTQINNANKAFDIPDIDWAGTTKQAVTDFSNKWQAAITGLVGKDENDTSSPASKLMIGVRTAASNFGWAEDTIKKAWDQFLSDLTSGGSDSNGSRNNTDGPVTETN